MLTLITGGSSSGKSQFAEDYCLSLACRRRYYIATMQPADKESRERIKRHREQRSKKEFITVEQYMDLERLELLPNSVVLLECMSNLLANERYGSEKPKAQAVSRIMAGITKLSRQAGHLIIVTNEVFSEGTVYEQETLDYLKQLGKVNCQIAAAADAVIEVVYTIPVVHKGADQIGYPL